jgi:hypothetical protein
MRKAPVPASGREMFNGQGGSPCLIEANCVL